MLTKKDIMKILYNVYSNSTKKILLENNNIYYQLCNNIDKIIYIDCNDCPYSGGRGITTNSINHCARTMYSDYITYTKLKAWNGII